MAKNKTSRTRKKVLTVEDLGVYISLLTDFGFKRVFGIKEVMIKDLNNMNIVRNEIRTLQNFISAEKEAHQRTRIVLTQNLAQKDNALAQKDNEIAELRRQLALIRD